MEMKLSNAQVRHLKALAQKMEATVKIGKAGLNEAFYRTLNEELARHELVKVKFLDLKEEKKELSPVLAEKTGSHLVTRVGNVVVLYRQQPDPARRTIRFAAAAAPATPGEEIA